MTTEDKERIKQELIILLAKTGALFFKEGLRLKDGRPTPYFINMGQFTTGRLSYELGRLFANFLVTNNLIQDRDILVGPSYKGSAIAQATAIALYKEYGIDVGFDYDRKEIKTHGESTIKASLFVNNLFFDGCNVILVDDVLTSMATKYELVDKIKGIANQNNQTITIKALVIAVDREQTTAVYDNSGKVIENLKGINPIEDFTTLTGIPVYSLIKVTEVIEYLFQKQIPISINSEHKPIDAHILEQFNKYIETYGTKLV